jgi:hypothetical protein
MDLALLNLIIYSFLTLNEEVRWWYYLGGVSVCLFRTSNCAVNDLRPDIVNGINQRMPVWPCFQDNVYLGLALYLHCNN